MNLTVLTWALAKVQRSKYVGVATIHCSSVALVAGAELTDGIRPSFNYIT